MWAARELLKLQIYENLSVCRRQTGRFDDALQASGVPPLAFSFIAAWDYVELDLGNACLGTFYQQRLDQFVGDSFVRT